MAGMINAELSGYVGFVKELQTLSSGKCVLNFTVATNPRKTDDPQWWNVAAFDRRAETLAKFLAKGNVVHVRGTLVQRKYEKNGVKQNSVSIVATDVQVYRGNTTRAGTSPEKRIEDNKSVSDDAAFPPDDADQGNIAF